MKKKINQQPNNWAIKLIEVNNKIKCYTAESVNRKIEAMQNRIDFLMGQNTRLKRAEKDLNSWKEVLQGHSRFTIRQMLEEKDNEKV